MGSIISLAGRAMRRAVGCVGWLMAVGAGMAAGQKPAPQQNVTVVVVDSHVDPSKPVAAVGVSLSYVDSGTRVTDARDVTNPKGEAYLQVSPDAPQRGDLRVEVSGATNLVIYQPADGQLQGLGSKVTVRLLPKGSAGLLGPAQIEAVLHRTLLQLNSLQKQNQTLKNQKPDLSVALAQVAQAYGFAPAEFDKKIEGWAHDVQADPAADARKKALAEVALKHYAEAAQLFTQATNADGADMDADEQKFLEGRRTKLRQLLSDAQQSANAAQLNHQYHLATTTLEAARVRAAAEQKRYPEDKALHEICFDADEALADAQKTEGGNGSPNDSLRLLVQSVLAYQELASQALAIGDRLRWAEIQLGLGGAYGAEAERTVDAQSPPLFKQAVQAYRNALTIYTATANPLYLARTEMLLGRALDAESFHVDENPDHFEVFAEAVLELRKAVDDFGKTNSPEGKARAQWALGELYSGEILYVTETVAGTPAATQHAQSYFTDAIQEFHAALDFYTKADYPLDWTDIQTEMGHAYQSISFHQTGAESDRSLDLTVEAYEHALEVFTQKDYPQGWAGLQNGIAAALDIKGERASGTEAEKLFDAARQHLELAQQVFTRTELPAGWFTTQSLLGQNSRDSGDYLKAAAIYETLFEADPRPGMGIASILASIYHEKLFRYDRALALNELVLNAYPSEAIRMDYIEENLTAEHFRTCIQQAKIVGDATTPASRVLNRDAIRLACEWGDGDKAAAMVSVQALLKEAAGLSRDSWNYEGTLHYLSISPKFEMGRASWIALFTSVQNGDAPGMTKALHDLEPLMQK